MTWECRLSLYDFYAIKLPQKFKIYTTSFPWGVLIDIKWYFFKQQSAVFPKISTIRDVIDFKFNKQFLSCILGTVLSVFVLF